MRALILVESVVVLALAGAILFGGTATSEGSGGDFFPAARFLLDAFPGETVVYRVDGGRSTLRYTVGDVVRGSDKGPPRAQITRAMANDMGVALPEESPTYTHLLSRHGFFALMAPEFPQAFDRVWVVSRIRRETVPWMGKPLRCWRVEGFDPALPEGSDAVVMWLHEDCPVFGVFQWERGHRKYEAEWRPPS